MLRRGSGFRSVSGRGERRDPGKGRDHKRLGAPNV